ncbi:unnamed protein product, partial [Porites evermanni]
MRQKDDKEFAELLNRLREGNHTQNDIEVLKERILKIRPGQENYPINMTHLFSTNAQVNNHNNTIYQASHTDKAQIKCIDIVVGDMSDALKKKMKEKIPDDPSKTMGLYTVVLIAVGAKYDLTANVNVTDGMTNDNFKLFRNDFCPQSNVRTAYGTAVYIKNSIKCKSEPYRCNFNDVEITVCIIHQPFPNLHIIGIYRSKAKVNLQSFITAINHVLDTVICDCNTPTVILGDFN